MALNEPRLRKAPAALAAAVAMAASMSVLAAVVVADIAEARATESVEQLDDVLPLSSPVTITKIKIQAPVPEAVDLVVEDPRPRKRLKQINFGRFEGY